MAKITYKRKECIGCGACTACSPEDWEMCDEDGKAHLIDSEEKEGIYSKEVDNILLKNNKDASEICPMEAIKVD